MKIKNIIKFVAPLSIAALLSACGGGGSSGGAVGIGGSAPDAPTVSLNYGIKELQFSWEAVPNATYYRLSENPDGTSGYSVVADNLTATSVNHDITLYQRINARYMVDACNDIGCSASSEILMTNHLADAIGYFKASITGSRVWFGTSVSLSTDGNTLAVGATDVDTNGAVYIFARSGATWVQQAYLKASNPGVGDSFGGAISLSSDGNTLAVGAAWESSSATGIDGDQSDNSALNSGAVYVFTRSGTTWAQQSYLKASNTGEYDHFGSSVSLSSDGNTLAVGARDEDSAATGIDGDQLDNSVDDSGAVYVFSRSGTTWTQQAYLKASNTGRYDFFGDMFGVSLSADGNTLAVGASGEDSNGAIGATYSGAVYVFIRSGSSWAQQAYLKATNSDGGDEFGTAVSLSSDGNTLAIGASGESSAATGVDGNQLDNSAQGSGAVYVFTRSNTTWTQQAYLKASNAEQWDVFGYGLSLSGDGNSLAVGAISESSAATGVDGDQLDNSALESGAVYLFTRSGSVWSQQAYIKASNTNAEDYFGWPSLSGDGSTLAVGGNSEDSAATGIGGDSADNSVDGSGAVYIY